MKNVCSREACDSLPVSLINALDFTTLHYITLNIAVHLYIEHSLIITRDGLMRRECLYSTRTREVLGNPSPPPSRFPSTLEPRIQYIPTSSNS